MLKEGQPFTLDTALDPKAGTIDAVGVAYKDLPKDVTAGDVLLLNDGQIVQHGSLVDLREKPANDFVSKFINAQRELAGL